MNHIVVTGFILATALAGCIEQPAEESLTISISDVGQKPYVIGVPLWLSSDGPNATTWMEHAAIHAGQVTMFHLQETEHGTALWIAGNGTVTVGFADVRSTNGAAFADGRFTLGVGALEGLPPRMVVETGDVDVQWFYEGVTETCFATGSYTWHANGTGEHLAQFGGRMSFSPDCPP